MTQEEYISKKKEILSAIPEEFHSYFADMAWDTGHACGYEEVLTVLGIMVDEFIKPLALYQASRRD